MTSRYSDERREAEALIRACEHDLKRCLSRGEMRDLLTDDTDWSRDDIRIIVASIFVDRP